MDPASLSLGILPLVAGAIKAYSGLKKNLEVFRHYSRELRRMRQRLDLERKLFLNETRILVLSAMDDHLLATNMLGNPDHDEWKSAATEDCFRKLLNCSYDEYFDTITNISEAIGEIQTELACFNLFEKERQDDEKLKETIYRLRDRMKITWNKTKLEEFLEELHESNGDLQRLGEQTRKIKEITSERFAVSDLKKQLPQEYADFGMVRRASKAFHNALANAWSAQDHSCPSRTSGRHDVRFFLDTKVLNSVSMDLVVVCPGHMVREANLPFDSFIPQPLKLQVRSQVMQWVESGLQSPPDSTNSTGEDSQAKRRRVHLSNDDAIPVNQVFPPTQQSQEDSQSSAIPNLSNRDLCSFLQKPCLEHELDKCVGYLDTFCDETFRHSIYNFVPDSQHLQKVVSMYQVLDNTAEKSVSIVDQLKLARSLVAAVLKFHSTPWLAQYLTLRDISLFQSSKDFSKCLPTLHLDTSFVDSRTDGAISGRRGVGTDGSEEAASTMARAYEDAKLDHGIRNMTLWCLGVILLQIGHWSRLSEPDDVRAVRRLSYKVPDIGPRYQQLARRCLECDFGYGEDLTRPRLQQAVYEKAYCELVTMIDAMDISEDGLH